MKIQISDHFSFPKLIIFTLPTIAMLVFTSLYSIVDGFFVSNYVGESAFAAINLVFPFIMILGVIGFMFGTGGSALVAKTLGENQPAKANSYFSMIVYSALILAVAISILGWFLINPVLQKFGADGELLINSVIYGKLLILSLPAFILQFMFQTLFITAGKPTLGLCVTLIAGFTNMFLDYIFIGKMHFGLQGAAYATIIGQFIGGILPILYFAKPNSSLLRLTKTNFDFKILLKTCINGSSEMVTQISMSLINMLYMWQLLRLTGQSGVAAFGVIMYLEFIFSGIFLGYSTGSSPIISYNYGAGNSNELKNLFRKSLIILIILQTTLTAIAEIFAYPLSGIFVGYSSSLHEMTTYGFRLYSLAFLIMGFNIFGSAFYTALNNGVISAIISFSRTCVFQVLCILILPAFFGINGIWSAIGISEILTLAITGSFLYRTKSTYGYV